MTPHLFAQALLEKLGAPYTPNNLAALVAAQGIEGGAMSNKAHYNPLNTTLKMPGSSSATSVGVQSYVSWAQGLDATVKTLTNGLYNDILASLRADNDPDVTLSKPGWKTWGWTSAILPAASYAKYSDKVFPDQDDSHLGTWGLGLAGLGFLGWLVMRKRG